MPHESLNNLSPMEYYDKIKDQYPNLKKQSLSQPLFIVNEPQKVYGML